MADDIEQFGALVKANGLAKRMNAGFSPEAFAAEMRALAAAVERGDVAFKRGGVVFDQFNAPDEVTRLLSMRGELVFEVKR